MCYAQTGGFTSALNTEHRVQECAIQSAELGSMLHTEYTVQGLIFFV